MSNELVGHGFGLAVELPLGVVRDKSPQVSVGRKAGGRAEAPPHC